MSGGIAIQVADRGCGILPGDEEKIFEKFHRGSGPNTDRRGTGLGLAICDAIVRAQKGRSRQEVVLVAVQYCALLFQTNPSRRRSRQRLMNNDMANPSAPLIAIIEDEAPIQKFLHASLQVEGFRIIQATTAKEGVRLITQEHPAIVLLDLGLPDADGISVITSIRGWSSLPIIVLSARGERKVRSKLLTLVLMTI